MDNRPIGVFDSGIGGMTVLKEIQKKLPQESFVYLGDTKRFPYGSKSKQDIIEYTKDGVEFLIKKNVKLIVIACGTATSQALEEVRRIYDLPIIGIIEPTVDYLKTTKKRRIGVIATNGTISSRGWEKAILNKIPEADIQSVACPLLAPMIEEDCYEDEAAEQVISGYLKQLKNIDALILGCTHYPLIYNLIKKQVGENVDIINVGTYVAEEIFSILKSNNLMKEKAVSVYRNDNLPLKNEASLDVFLTKTDEKFSKLARKLLGKEVKVEIIG